MAEADPRREYCSPAHKQAAYRERHPEMAKSTTLDRQVAEALADARQVTGTVAPDPFREEVLAKVLGPRPDQVTIDWNRWLRTGEPPDMASKAALIEDVSGQYLIPADITVEILDVAQDRARLRQLAAKRPTNRNKQRAGLLTVAAVGWGRPEVTGSTTDANTLPESPGQEIEVFDLVAQAKIGTDELDDSPEAAQAAVVEAIGTAIGDAEAIAFASGSGTDRPKGIALASNISRVPSGQKTTAAATNTPTLADVQGLPWKLPDKYRERASWVMHATAAQKIGLLTYTNGDALWPNAGNPDPTTGGGLLGWPAYVVPGMPDPATVGTADASVLFGDIESAYRVLDRQRGITVQRLTQKYAEQGQVGILVRWRTGGDLIRPGALAAYLL